jgi:hypothetical protein
MTIHLYCMHVHHEADGRSAAPQREQPDLQQGRLQLWFLCTSKPLQRHTFFLMNKVESNNVAVAPPNLKLIWEDGRVVGRAEGPAHLQACSPSSPVDAFVLLLITAGGQCHRSNAARRPSRCRLCARCRGSVVSRCAWMERQHHI